MATATATRADSTLTVPYRYQPRPYQLPILRAIDNGYKRICWVAHRRSGKDKTCTNIVAKKMLERVGAYYYIFPEYNQGRKVIWDGMGQDGMRFLDHFPAPLLAGKPNNTEMKVRYRNRSLFQVVGGDRIDAIMGTNPVGVVLTEYSLMNPAVWRFLRPILAENGGWAIFVYTPRGENHGFTLYELAKNDPEWWCQLDPVSKTKAISRDILDKELREIVHQDGNDALYQQEYECNFTVPIAGAYYAAQIMRAYQEGRVGRVPHDPRYKVDTWWDLGYNDRMAIWFTQRIGGGVRVIDYEEGSGEGLISWIGRIKEKGYIYGVHCAPHDIKTTEITSGKTRWDTAAGLGITFRVAPKLTVRDGIDIARALLTQCWFDAERCADGLNALKNYRKKYDERRRTYLNEAYHDWSSNGADAFRTFATGDDYRMVSVPARRDPWAAEAPRRTLSPDAV